MVGGDLKSVVPNFHHTVYHTKLYNGHPKAAADLGGLHH